MIIFRYLAKEILSSICATSLVVLIIFVANAFIQYLNQAASGTITIHAVLMVTLVYIPLMLSYILSLGTFLGVLLALGRLYVDHEMVVLSSCGFSRAKLVGYVMVIALFVTVFDAWLMLSVEPAMFRYRTQLVIQSAETATLEKVVAGRFQTFGKAGNVFYVGKVNKSKQEFQDVFVAIPDQGDKKTQRPYSWDVLGSDSVQQQMEPKIGDFFVFTNGFRFTGTPGQADFRKVHFKEYWARLPVPEVSTSGYYSAMPTSELVKHFSTDRISAAELQWRLAIVFSVLVFAFLGISLSEVNPRKGKFIQLLPAILIYIAYANMMFVGKTWIQTGVTPRWLGLWWILGILVLIALLLFLYKVGWRRIFGSRR